MTATFWWGALGGFLIALVILVTPVIAQVRLSERITLHKPGVYVQFQAFYLLTYTMQGGLGAMLMLDDAPTIWLAAWVGAGATAIVNVLVRVILGFIEPAAAGVIETRPVAPLTKRRASWWTTDRLTVLLAAGTLLVTSLGLFLD